jgi:glycine cleavage system transcriptional repressor
MDTVALISVAAALETGLIAAITGRLYDIGADLGDTTFAVLGGAAEFTAVCELPAGALIGLGRSGTLPPARARQCKLSVTPFGYQPIHADQAHITHRIEITGRDGPGSLHGFPRSSCSSAPISFG